MDLETGDIIENQIFYTIYNESLDIFQFSLDPATSIIPVISKIQKTFTA